MKIRAITVFADVGPPLNEEQIAQLAAFARVAREAFEDDGFEVQTTRLATHVFPRLRFSDWVDKPVEMAVTLEKTCQAHGFNYVSIGPADPDDTLSLVFPIEERTVVEVVGCVLYTLVIKGNDVVFIDPPGKHHPLYQRAHYRQDQTRWRKAERFVTQEHFVW